MEGFAPLPDPPYYAVIFTSLRSGEDEGYAAMAEEMDRLAAEQPGYIGVEFVRNQGGQSITVSYWRTQEALQNWKAVAAHTLAQQLGKDRWYRHYTLRVARVERAYSGPEGR
ncbi:MAG: antibiotic biosynthesis monooxygenase [Rhodobacteraceae bacterium]|nr:antibiotic biosynthesis monooxygenase [Paracoccaceae bacterium]